MNPFLATAVFAVVLFIYIHIYHHVKVSNDLEVYEVVAPSKEQLEEICDIRQPALFTMDVGDVNEALTRKSATKRYGAFDISIRNVSNEVDDGSGAGQLYVPLALGAAEDMLATGNATGIFSERNDDFLVETGLVNQMKHNDSMLRPHMVSRCSYDWIIGSNGTRTPFRYELDYRNYLVVTEGKARIKLAPPKSGKYIHVNKDYTNFEFKSAVDPWDPQPHYRSDFSKVKCLEMTLTPGQVFYVPAYWFYSIEFSEETSLCKFSYQTYMGTLSIIHYHTISFLQRHNTRDKVAASLEPVVAGDTRSVEATGEPNPGEAANGSVSQGAAVDTST